MIFGLLLLVGCGGSGPASDAGRVTDGGRGSGALCPSGSTLTYESFGRNFFETYCVRCHASTLVGVARNGAPNGHDFDTLAGAQLEIVHIDQQAAIGPNRENRFMPFSGTPVPTDEERRQLGEWIACGAL